MVCFILTFCKILVEVKSVLPTFNFCPWSIVDGGASSHDRKFKFNSRSDLSENRHVSSKPFKVGELAALHDELNLYCWNYHYYIVFFDYI